MAAGLLLPQIWWMLLKGSPGLCVSGQLGRWTWAGPRGWAPRQAGGGGPVPMSPGGGPAPRSLPPQGKREKTGDGREGDSLATPHSLGLALRPSVSMLTAPAWVPPSTQGHGTLRPAQSWGIPSKGSQPGRAWGD